MGRIPENPYLIAVRQFPARLQLAKKAYELKERGGKDLDWDDFAVMANLTKSVMSEVKLGKRAPRLVEVVVFSTILSCRPEWLAFASGEMAQQQKAPTADQERRTTVVEGITEHHHPDRRKKGA